MYHTTVHNLNIKVKLKFKTQINKNIFSKSEFFQLNNAKKLCFFIFILHIRENCHLILNFNFKKLKIMLGSNFFLFSEEQFLKKFLLK